MKQFYSSSILQKMVNVLTPHYDKAIKQHQNDLYEYEKYDNDIILYVNSIVEPVLTKLIEKQYQPKEPKKSFWSRLFDRKKSKPSLIHKHFTSVDISNIQKQINQGLPEYIGYGLVIDKYLCEPYDGIINKNNLLYKQYISYNFNSIVITARKIYPVLDDYNVKRLKSNLTELNEKRGFLQQVSDKLIGSGLIFDEDDVEWMEIIQSEYELLINYEH